MGEDLNNKYHISKEGEIYRINDDGSFTDLGNAEKRVKKEPAQVAPRPQKNNYLIPLMQRHWAYHCAHPNMIVCTIFMSGVRSSYCQLLSNKTDQLLLNFTLESPEDKERLYRFKKHRYYSLFENDRDVYVLELGGVTDWSIQIVTEILTDVFGISVFQEISVSFETEVLDYFKETKSQPQTSRTQPKPWKEFTFWGWLWRIILIVGGLLVVIKSAQ